MAEIFFNGSGIIHLDHRAVSANMLSTADWSSDLTGSTADFAQYVNGASTNTRVRETGPFGEEVYVWNGNTVAASACTAGWYSSQKTVDYTKTYRVTCWVRVKTAVTANFYIGLEAYNSGGSGINMKRVTTGVEAGNVWCMNGGMQGLTTGTWYLFSAYIRPYGYAGTTNDAYTGLNQADGTNLGVGGGTGDQIMLNTTAKIAFRTFGPYNTTSGEFQWGYPRLELVDGTEVPFNEILTGRKGLLLK